jgi:hypothetical protein
MSEWVCYSVTDVFLMRVLDVSRGLHTPEHVVFLIPRTDLNCDVASSRRYVLITINRIPEGLGVSKISIYTWKNSSSTLDNFQCT